MQQRYDISLDRGTNCLSIKEFAVLEPLKRKSEFYDPLKEEFTFLYKMIYDAKIIQKAIDNAHKKIGKEIFTSPLVPDVAFTPRVRANYTHYIAMYHDQGLAPLKALYFDEGINVSLNLPILRTSVDHGTAFDIAYKGIKLSSLSYLNAVKYIVNH